MFASASFDTSTRTCGTASPTFNAICDDGGSDLQGNKVYVPHSDTRDILAGALLGRLLSVVAPIVAGPLVIYPVNVSIVLLAVLGAIQRLQPKLDWPWRVIMGISLDGVVFLIIRETYGYYSNPAIVGALVLLLIYIALAPLREKATHVWRKGDQRHYFRVWTSLGTAAFIIVWMRVTYLAVMDIPNAERSFFIAGYEFHHICMGLTGLLILEHWPVPRTKKGVITFAIVHGIATGWIFDQALFFAMLKLTEESYQHPLSLFGAISTWVAAILITVVILPSNKPVTQIRSHWRI